MSIVLDGTTGITTPGLTNTGTETLVNLTTTGNTTLGDASTDTLNVGNGGLVKDASGNVGINQSSPSGKLHVVGATNNWTQVVAGSTTSTQSYGLRIQAGTTSADTSFLIRDATNATDYLTVIGNGNVGVGNSAPSAKLQVDASNFALATSYNTLSSNFAVRTTTSAAANVGGEIALGGYGNGTSSPCDFARIHGKKENGTAGNVSGYLAFEVSYDGGPSPYIFERARIDSSGNLLVGTTSASSASSVGIKFQYSATVPAICTVVSSSVNADVGYTLYSTGAGAYRFYVGAGGTVYATNTTITAISDQRLKENIRDLDDGLEKVMALQPRKFDWKEGKGADIKNARGFIAQEFETVFPDMIDEWKDPAPEGEESYKAINANLIPTLVKAIQEQQAIITTLTNRITALEAK